ncbi:MAG: ABC transporter ATP-binding protein [Gaiellales bacterium]
MRLEAERTVAVVGPSGAGKSTILRLIAGLMTPASGRVECDGEQWFARGINLPPERRRVGFVFQHYALFPHLSVRRNVGFQARRPIWPLLERLRIDHLEGARPSELSGGERQRVALARALATDPHVLLLDEPLNALDPTTREAVAGELAHILRETGVPSLVVTHAYDEAAALAERVVVVDAGRVVQEGAPQELLDVPASRFVADFAGMNYLPGLAAGRAVSLARGNSVSIADPAQGPVAVLVAPWDITLSRESPADTSALNHLQGTVRRVTVLGNRARVAMDDLTAEVTPESVERLGIRSGDTLVATWKATSTRVVARSDGEPADS